MKLAHHHLQSLLAVRPLERIYAGSTVGNSDVSAAGGEVLVRQLLPGLPEGELSATAAVFARHMERLTQLSSPGTLPVREYVRSSAGPFYYVTDVPAGTTLGELVRGAGSLPAGTVAAVGLSAAEGLAHAHGVGVWHLGLHRSQLLVGPDGAATILDLGLLPLLLERVEGRLREVDSAWEYLFPDPGAVAPELLAGRTPGAHTDVYGLGALMYLMATAVLPYTGSSVLAYNAILAAAAPPDPRRDLPDLRPELADLIARCLHPDPEARPTTMAALVELLRPLADPLPSAVDVYRPLLLDRSYLDRFEPLLRVVDGGRGRPAEAPPPSRAVVPLFGGETSPPTQAELLAAMSPEQRRIYLSAGMDTHGEPGLTRRDQIRRGAVLGVILAVLGMLALLPSWMDSFSPTPTQPMPDLDRPVVAEPSQASPQSPAPAAKSPRPDAPAIQPAVRTVPLLFAFRRPPEPEVRPRQRGSIEASAAPSPALE